MFIGETQQPRYLLGLGRKNDDLGRVRGEPFVGAVDSQVVSRVGHGVRAEESDELIGEHGGRKVRRA